MCFIRNLYFLRKYVFFAVLQKKKTRLFVPGLLFLFLAYHILFNSIHEVSVREVLGKLQVGSGLLGQRSVFGDSGFQAADYHCVVIGAGAYHGFQVVGVSVGVFNGSQRAVGFVAGFPGIAAFFRDRGTCRNAYFGSCLCVF